MNVKIKMTEDNYYKLLRLLNREWREEADYLLMNNDDYTDYLEELYDIYEELLGKAGDFIHAYAIADDLEGKRKDLEEVKENARIYRKEMGL